MITRLMARKRKAVGNALEFASLTPKRRSTRKQGRLKKRNKYRVHLSDSISIFHDQKLSKHGEVYEGEQRHGDFASLTIAVKVVDKNELTEARILAKLNHHSHVISLIDSGFYHNGFVNRVYMALDKCHKENLREFVTNRKKQGIIFDINRTTEIAKQIIEGVEYIHSKKIVHKDLKPDNILFSLDQRMIKIADFGLSEEIDSVSAKVSVKGHFGTAGYRPPESFGNSIISLTSDIYSLGIILYYILSNGEHPFGDDPDDWNSKMKNGLFDLSKLLVTNPKTTKHLIECMIEIKLSNRPTIWQVSLHPCWGRNEVECSFDYHCDETSDTPILDKEQVSEHNVCDLWKLVQMMEKRTLVGKEKNPDIFEGFMPPDDPLGRNGPSLDNFLRIRSLSEEKNKPDCPYGGTGNEHSEQTLDNKVAKMLKKKQEIERFMQEQQQALMQLSGMQEEVALSLASQSASAAQVPNQNLKQLMQEHQAQMQEVQTQLQEDQAQMQELLVQVQSIASEFASGAPVPNQSVEHLVQEQQAAQLQELTQLQEQQAAQLQEQLTQLQEQLAQTREQSPASQSVSAAHVQLMKKQQSLTQQALASQSVNVEQVQLLLLLLYALPSFEGPGTV